MEAPSHCIILDFVMPHYFILRTYLNTTRLLRLWDLWLWVNLFLNIEMNYIFALGTDSKLNLRFTWLVGCHAYNFSKLNFHACPAMKPIKVFLILIVTEEMNPSIFSSNAEIIFPICWNARVCWRYLIWVFLCYWRWLYFETSQKLKHLEHQ